jgi:hypothetical protein
MDPAFQALVAQAKRVCARHPGLLPAYLATIRDKGRGMPPEVLEALLKDVSAACAPADAAGRVTDAR